MSATHAYEVTVEWTGNLGEGTRDHRAFSRAHDVLAGTKPPIAASADPAFRGDEERWNPEELLLSALAQCHMLWYLHLCSVRGVVVSAYEDHATATMAMDASGGGGAFTEAVLRPEVTVDDETMVETARGLHAEVPARCFIARSVNFPVRHEPTVRTQTG
jgi:organic hydroperoxide reductase OsmC/OhrA